MYLIFYVIFYILCYICFKINVIIICYDKVNGNESKVNSMNSFCFWDVCVIFFWYSFFIFFEI